MSRGVVLRLDERAAEAVRQIWADLEHRGIPSLETASHALHEPHISLAIAETIDLDDLAARLSDHAAPGPPVELRSLGFFPGGGAFLPVVPTLPLLQLQHRMRALFEACSSADGLSAHTATDSWNPHVSLTYAVAPDRVGDVAAAVLPRLPLDSPSTQLWIEDGATGEAWPVSP